MCRRPGQHRDEVEQAEHEARPRQWRLTEKAPFPGPFDSGGRI